MLSSFLETLVMLSPYEGSRSLTVSHYDMILSQVNMDIDCGQTILNLFPTRVAQPICSINSTS